MQSKQKILRVRITEATYKKIQEKVKETNKRIPLAEATSATITREALRQYLDL